MASSSNVNQWNTQWRSSPLYGEVMQYMGVDPSKAIKLTDQQRKFVQSYVEQKTGVKFDNGLEIDPAGNMNEDEGFGKQLKKWGPIVGGAALTLFGIPGVLPGLLSGGAAAGAGAASTAAGGAFDTVTAAQSAAGIASMAGSGLGTGASMGGWGAVLGALKNPKTLAGIGSMLTSGSQASASNRGSEIEALLAAQLVNDRNTAQYNTSVADRDASERAAQGDAWKRLQQSQYVANWKQPEARFSPYSKPLIAPSEATRSGAMDLSKTAGDRLAGRTSLPAISVPEPFSIPSNLTKGSAWEKLFGLAGAGLDAYGSVRGRRTA